MEKLSRLLGNSGRWIECRTEVYMWVYTWEDSCVAYQSTFVGTTLETLVVDNCRPKHNWHVVLSN